MQVDEHSEGLSRADAILRGALAAGAILGLGMIGPHVERALALAGDNDVDTLNLLLEFEYLQVELYEGGRARLKPEGKPKELIATLLDQEQRHVKALTEAIGQLGGKPLSPDKDYGAFAYHDDDPITFLRLAQEVENAAIGAYNGAIPLLKSEDLLRLAASIVQVEGRHAAAVALRGENEPAPEAFDAVRTEYEALRSVIRFTGPI